MNTHPILFSPPMVEAILRARKTQTRRLVTPNYDDSLYLSRDGNAEYNHGTIVKCPFGKVGDILWVRETFFAYGTWEKNGKTKGRKQKWKFLDVTGENFDFKYLEIPPLRVQKGKGTMGWYKRPSLFMPKKACRFFLEITAIRVEKLCSIKRQDCISEGIFQGVELEDTKLELEYYQSKFGGERFPSAYQAFSALWQSINGEKSWESNPWVWVIEFKRVSKPENFLS